MSTGTDIIKKLKRGEFLLLLPEVTFRCCADPEGRILSGVGQIEGDRNRRLLLRVFIEDEANDIFDSIPVTGSGQLIPDEALFDFCAMDEMGSEWRAERIYLNRSTFHTRKNCVVHSHLGQLQRILRVDAEWDPKEILILYDHDFDVPFLDVTHSSTKFEGEEIASDVGLNANFKTLGAMAYEMKKIEGMFSIDCRVDDLGSPVDFAHMVTAALQFVTGYDMRWGWYETMGNRRNISCLWGRGGGDRTIRFYPPIQEGLWWSYRTEFWDIFDRLLLFLHDQTKEARDQLCYLIGRMIQDSACSIDSRSRAMTIGIEELLKLIPPYGIRVDSNSNLEIKKIQEYVNKYPAGETETGDRIKNRVLGSIAAMSNLRAKDILMEMRSRKLISRNEYHAWDKLRNSQAHGEISADSNLQTTLDRLDCVVSIFHKIILYKIGFNGTITEYSQRGWPAVSFECKENCAD